MGNSALDAIADSLQSGNCPSDLELHVGSNGRWTIGRGWDNPHAEKMDANRFLHALKSGKCPPKLTLDFFDGPIDLQLFAETLMSGQCPAFLDIFFAFQLAKLNDSDADIFRKAFQSGNCPAQLTMHFTSLFDNGPEFQKLIQQNNDYHKSIEVVAYTLLALKQLGEEEMVFLPFPLQRMISHYLMIPIPTEADAFKKALEFKPNFSLFKPTCHSERSEESFRIHRSLQ